MGLTVIFAALAVGFVLGQLCYHFKVMLNIRAFTTMGLIRWMQKRARKAHAEKIAAGRKAGRPKTPDYIVQAILTIKRENPHYTAGRIARMLSNSELKFSISKQTVSKILKAHGFKPPPRSKRSKSNKNQTRQQPSWKATLYNQGIMAMDFKVVLDFSGNSLFILNIIDHGRRVLHWSRATYNPTSEWVSQQLRNAFMDLDTPPDAILMDRDTIFFPIAKRTLPNMGIKAIRTAYKCPWQNAVVERFNRTLTDELLQYVQPMNETHLNRLLKQYREYYNTARPHMTNHGEPPIAPTLPQTAANDPDYNSIERKLVRKRWLGGLHSSYRWAA